MTIKMFFRLLRNRKIDYQLFLNGTQIKCNRRVPTPYWGNEISAIDMIQKTFIFHITDNIIPEEYNTDEIKVKYCDLVNVLNENVYIFSPVKYIKNPNIYMEALYIEKDGCLEVY